MRIRYKTLLSLTLAAVFATLAVPAFAGGPLAVCDCGVPFLWPNGGANIPFNPDQGDLAILTNAQATQLVIDSFQAWEDVADSTASYFNAGTLPVDVDDTNFVPFLFPGVADGLSPIVYDDDGAIFDLLFGPGSGVLGFAGPDVFVGADCEIIEGAAFLNGPSFGNLLLAENVMVHEFGHYTNLAHTVVNGQIFLAGEGSGPGADFGTFGVPPFLFGNEVVATMYPFLFGGGDQLTRTPHADDIAILSTLYPESNFFSTTGAISGAILAPNGTSPITGVNVIARNLADPFTDAVSAISSDFTDDFSGSCDAVGRYTINNLTPGADYAVFVDEIIAGGFSTPPASPLPGPEEFYNGASETGDSSDVPLDLTPITVAAGSPNTDIDILFNGPDEGAPLAVGDDGSVQIFMPFNFTICDQDFDSLFVNANGNLTFGTGDGAFVESIAGHLDGPPRIAAAWDDLNPSAGGSVFFTTTNNTFTVTWDDVPEFFATGSNTFSIELKKASSQVTVDYGDLTMTDGLAGVSCGLHDTGGLESETVLNDSPKKTTHNFNGETAVYELFSTGDNDLANYSVKYNTMKHDLSDVFENNNSLATAAAITPPLNTAPNSLFTEISPAAADIDFFSFTAEAGQTVIAEITRGQIDSVLGLFDSAGMLIDFNDDSNGLLSAIQTTLPADDTYTLAVTFCCDFDFDGVDPGQGPPLDEGRYVLDLQVVDGIPLSLGDDDFVQVGFGFTFPFQGQNYTDVFVNANGNLTFGSADTTLFTWLETVPDFLAGPPRISPLWDDLSPNNGGLVLFKEGTDCVKVTWANVPEFSNTGSNTFAATFDDAGNIQFDYGALSATDGLAGITEGGFAADPGESDLGTGGPFPILGTTYENFDGLDNDLSGASVVFGSATSCD